LSNAHVNKDAQGGNSLQKILRFFENFSSFLENPRFFVQNLQFGQKSGIVRFLISEAGSK
jgi:hypothetical protein